jgi:hypothetical protein
MALPVSQWRLTRRLKAAFGTEDDHVALAYGCFLWGACLRCALVVLQLLASAMPAANPVLLVATLAAGTLEMVTAPLAEILGVAFALSRPRETRLILMTLATAGYWTRGLFMPGVCAIAPFVPGGPWALCELAARGAIGLALLSASVDRTLSTKALPGWLRLSALAGTAALIFVTIRGGEGIAQALAALPAVDPIAGALGHLPEPIRALHRLGALLVMEVFAILALLVLIAGVRRPMPRGSETTPKDAPTRMPIAQWRITRRLKTVFGTEDERIALAYGCFLWGAALRTTWVVLDQFNSEALGALLMPLMVPVMVLMLLTTVTAPIADLAGTLLAISRPRDFRLPLMAAACAVFWGRGLLWPGACGGATPLAPWVADACGQLARGALGLALLALCLDRLLFSRYLPRWVRGLALLGGVARVVTFTLGEEGLPHALEALATAVAGGAKFDQLAGAIGLLRARGGALAWELLALIALLVAISLRIRGARRSCHNGVP